MYEGVEGKGQFGKEMIREVYKGVDCMGKETVRGCLKIMPKKG